MSDFLLPDIGEGIVECEVVEWRVAEGDTIEEDQPIVEVMTDKALVEITAPEAGMVTKLYVPQGNIAKVHAPLYAYQTAGQPNSDTAATEQAPSAPPSSQGWPLMKIARRLKAKPLPRRLQAKCPLALRCAA